jgi:hypothetical protein
VVDVGEIDGVDQRAHDAEVVVAAYADAGAGVTMTTVMKVNDTWP